jgi:hypothetical protein
MILDAAGGVPSAAPDMLLAGQLQAGANGKPTEEAFADAVYLLKHIDLSYYF